jgi:hypothetical protein
MPGGGSGYPSAVATDQRSLEHAVEPEQLDSDRDRKELRDRYYGLLQELRIVVPGVLVLVGFQLTAPFATHFGQVDDTGQALYGAALTIGVLSVIAFMTPAVLHRFGDRTARSARLELSIATTRIGLVLFGLSLICSLAVVVRFLFDPTWSTVLIVVTVAAMVTMWGLIPRLVHDRHETTDHRRG